MIKYDNDIDILDIDNKIRINFKEEEENIPKYKAHLESLNKSLELKNIRTRVVDSLLKSVKELEEHIQDIESNTSLNFYMAETGIFLEKYKDILKAPIKVNFMGKAVKNNKDKDIVINDYLEIARKYVDVDIPKPCNEKENVVCLNCQNKKEFDIVDTDTYVCSICSVQQVILKSVSSYKDIDRVNISSKYMYDRKIHFRDCINQYQGDSIFCIFFAKICIFHIVNYFFLRSAFQTFDYIFS